MQLVVGFVIGLVLGFGTFMKFVPKHKIATSQVLAEKIEIATPTPTESPTPTDSLTPIPTLIKPTPSPITTLSPILTIPLGPTTTPDVWSPASIEPIMARYALLYGVDKNLLERIANCESHFNPNAQNGVYMGLFQFGPTTWIINRTEMGLDQNLALRANMEESIKTAAYLISKRGADPWPGCIH